MASTSSTPDAVALEEARGALPLFVGRRLRLARESLGLTQRAFAEQMDDRVTPAALSQFERGDVKPSAATLAEVAAVTTFPPRFFTRDPAIGDVASTNGFFRSLRSTGVRERRRHRAKAELVRLATVALERLVRLPTHDVPRIPISANTARTDVEVVATQVRAAW